MMLAKRVLTTSPHSRSTPIHEGQDHERGQRRDHRDHRVTDDLESVGASSSTATGGPGRSSWFRGYFADFRCRLGPCHPVIPTFGHTLGCDRRDRPVFATLLRRGGQSSTGGSLQVATPADSLGDSARTRTGCGGRREAAGGAQALELDAGRRRFTWASVVAIALMAVPFVWILWSVWGPVNPLRPSNYQDNFYDLQTRAMFQGHLPWRTVPLASRASCTTGAPIRTSACFPRSFGCRSCW